MSASLRPSRSRHAVLAALALVAGLALMGCQEVPSNLVNSEPYELEAIEGTDRMRVKLTDETAAKIDLRTAPVKAIGRTKIVPHEALIYNPNGDVFVYTRPSPQTYVRAPVTVDRVEGARAWLSKGPPAATVVVTVGAAELLATEYEILNQHP